MLTRSRFLFHAVIAQYLNCGLLDPREVCIDLTGRQALYRAGGSLIPQFAWNNTDATGGWNADIATLKALHPGLTTMKQWVRQFDWRTAG